MADSIADTPIATPAWVDVSVATGIIAGTAITIQNKGITPILMWIGAIAPAADATDGLVIYDYPHEPSQTDVASGASKVWLRATTTDGSVHIRAV